MQRNLLEEERGCQGCQLLFLVLRDPALRNCRDPHLAAWYEGVAEDEISLSTLVIGEIRRGIEKTLPKALERNMLYRFASHHWQALEFANESQGQVGCSGVE